MIDMPPPAIERVLSGPACAIASQRCAVAVMNKTAQVCDIGRPHPLQWRLCFTLSSDGALYDRRDWLKYRVRLIEMWHPDLNYP